MIYRRLRRWLQIKTKCYDTPIDGGFPCWVLSFGIHLLALVLLAKVFIIPKEDVDVVLVVETTETIELDFKPVISEISFDDVSADDLGDEAEDTLVNEVAEMSPAVEFVDDYDVDLELSGMAAADEMLELDLDFENVSGGSGPVQVGGGIGSVSTGTSGAVDRITQEILIKLEDKKTIVVWLFDQSASLVERRSDIQSRFDKIYDELGLLEAASSQAFAKYEDRPLLTQVYAYGNSVQRMLKKPTDNLDEIKSAVSKIPNDNSGVENVFGAVLKCVEDFRNYRKLSRSEEELRNVMFIVITDEAGDDILLVDKAVQHCNQYQIPVYTIGVPAPFGRQYAHVKWVDPDPTYDQRPQYSRIHQGPESMYPERLNLNITDVDSEKLKFIDSGFGPFGLTRLCSETAGIFFSVEAKRGEQVASETTKYAPAVMQQYRPEYVSIQEYQRRTNSSLARAGLVKAALLSQKEELECYFRRSFPRFEEAAYINRLSRAQQEPAKLEPKLEQLCEALKRGEQDRANEKTLRWQAGYDLAFGRALATWIRVKTYNEMLAMAKTRLKFSNPRNNTWVVVPTNEISTGSRDQRLALKAKEYLERVIREHPNTPWATLAERELEQLISWKWTETYTEPQPRQPFTPSPPKEKRPPPNL